MLTTDGQGKRRDGAESGPGHCHDDTRGLVTCGDVTTAFIHQQHNNIDLTQQQLLVGGEIKKHLPGAPHHCDAALISEMAAAGGRECS